MNEFIQKFIQKILQCFQQLLDFFIHIEFVTNLIKYMYGLYFLF